MGIFNAGQHRNTGTMIRATFVEPSRCKVSARLMLCTISTCEPRVSAKHTASPPLAGDVDAFPEHANAREERPVDPVAGRVEAVGELPQHLPPFDHEVVTAQPRRPHPVRRDVTSGLEFVELRVDRLRSLGLVSVVVRVGGDVLGWGVRMGLPGR
jgi:hypothetical protein